MALLEKTILIPTNLRYQDSINRNYMLSLLKYGKPMFGIQNRIRIRMFLGLPAPDPDPAPDPSLFLINVLNGLQNKILIQNFSKKLNLLDMKMMCLWASYKKI